MVEAEARETVLAVHDYAVGLGMPRIDRPITILLYHNLDALAAEFEAATGRAWDENSDENVSRNSENWIFVNTSPERYQEYSSEDRKRNLAVHLSDAYLRMMSDLPLYASDHLVPPAGPRWLFHGSRRFLTWQALRAPGPESCDRTRGGGYARFSEAADTPLSDAETRSGYESMRSAYQHSFLAAEFLAEQAGQESIIGYFASLQPGVAWQGAFQTNFGMTVADFYQLFEERRAAGFPRPRCPILPPLVTMPGAPEYTKWEIGSDVRPEYVEDVIEGVHGMHEYAGSLGMPEMEAQVTIHLYHNQDKLIAAYAIVTGREAEWVARGSNAVAGAGRFFVDTLRWEERKTRPEGRKKISAHELFHVFQHELSWGHRGPTWMTEGTAEFLAFKAMDAAGVFDYERERDSTNRWGFVERGKNVAEPLKDMETSHKGVDYTYFLLAAELLAHHAGESTLINYFASIQLGTTWQQAFQTTFGMAVEEFYVLFEEHRAAGFPEVEVSK